MSGALEEIAGSDHAAIACVVEAADRPVVIRGIASRLARGSLAAREGEEAIAAYLAARDNGKPLTVLVGPSETGGRYFYTDDMRGVNFRSEKMPMTALVERLLALRGTADAPTLYAGSTPRPKASRALPPKTRCPSTPASNPAYGSAIPVVSRRITTWRRTSRLSSRAAAVSPCSRPGR